MYTEDFSREKKAAAENAAILASLESSGESSWGRLGTDIEVEESNGSDIDPADLEYFEKILKKDVEGAELSKCSEKFNSDAVLKED